MQSVDLNVYRKALAGLTDSFLPGSFTVIRHLQYDNKCTKTLQDLFMTKIYVVVLPLNYRNINIKRH